MEKCHKRHIRQIAISFSPFLLFPAGGIVERGVRLGNRVLPALLVLVEHAAIAKVWPNQAVKQASPGFQIGALRRALGNGNVPRRRGYCFVAPMTRLTLTPSTAENAPSNFSSHLAHALDAKRLQRVLDLVEARLETDVKVADLASVAPLGRFHFSRAFRGATGKTPDCFVSDPPMGLSSPCRIRPAGLRLALNNKHLAHKRKRANLPLRATVWNNQVNPC
jgi:DNA-binding winged helix-turn-helix (wHTH) protein